MAAKKEVVNAGTERCRHCNGTLRAVGRGVACGTCGREPNAPASLPAATPVASSSSTPVSLPPGRSCSVDGCPGIVRGSAPCECCALRAEWERTHRPERPCQICKGIISGTRKMKYCGACKMVANKVAQSNAPSKAGRKATAST